MGFEPSDLLIANQGQVKRHEGGWVRKSRYFLTYSTIYWIFPFR